MKGRFSKVALGVVFFQAVAFSQSSRPLHTQDYTKTVLFSLKYGSEPGEIGVLYQPGEGGDPETVRGFTLTPQNRFLFGDNVNNSLKCFDSKGKLLFQTQGAERGLGKIEDVQSSTEGEIFVLRFDREFLVQKYSATGALQWTRQPVDVRPSSMEQNDKKQGIAFFPQLFPLPHGAVGVATYLPSQSGKQFLSFFDSQGQFQKVLRGEIVSLTGKVFVFDFKSKTDYTRFMATETDMNGQATHQFTVDVGPQYRPYLQDAKPFRPLEVGLLRTTPTGTLYSTQWVSLKPGAILFKEFRPQTFNTIITYDQQGHPVQLLRCPATIFGSSSSNVSMDSQGTITTLEFGSKSVAVVRYRLKKPLAPTSKK